MRVVPKPGQRPAPFLLPAFVSLPRLGAGRTFRRAILPLGTKGGVAFPKGSTHARLKRKAGGDYPILVFDKTRNWGYCS